MKTISLIISFFLGAFFVFVLQGILAFASTKNELETFSKENYPDDYGK